MIRTKVVLTTVVGAVLAAAPTYAQVNIEQIVRQKVQPILPKGGGGGVAGRGSNEWEYAILQLRDG
jgi:hypothetical protein